MKQILLIALLFSYYFSVRAQIPARPYIQNLSLAQENIVSFPLNLIGKNFLYPTDGTWFYPISEIKIDLYGEYIISPTQKVLQTHSYQTVVRENGVWYFSNFNPLHFQPGQEYLANVEATYILTIWHEYHGQKSKKNVYYLRKLKSKYTPPGIYWEEYR